jgi:hypothetical protein
MKNLSHDSRSLDGDLNPRHSAYEGTLTVGRYISGLLLLLNY